ncbi:MAG: DMT family transporter [Acidobacteria bacterium]|nr:DMT family transporter [Acidobacteriota bacterium]
MKNHKALAALLLLFVVAVWGATFPLVKRALQDCSPLFFNQVRMLFAFAILAVVHLREWRQMNRRSLITGAIAGFFLAAGYEFQTAGLALTTPSKSAFLTGMIVVIVPVLSMLPGLRVRGVPLRAGRTMFASLIAFAGIVLLTVPAHTAARELFSAINRGDVLTLFCALAFAMHLLTLSKASHGISIAQLATLQIGFCALFMSITTPMVERISVHWTATLLIVLAICAVFATAAAFSIQSWAQRHLPSSQTALLLSLEPVFAWMVSLLFFGERLGARSMTGAAMIFAAILLTEIGASPSSPDPNAAPIPES